MNKPADTERPAHDEDEIDAFLRGEWRPERSGVRRIEDYDRLGGDAFVAEGWRAAIADRIERVACWGWGHLIAIAGVVRGQQ